MEITNCIWEIDNLGEKTCEVCIRPSDIFDEEKIKECTKSFKYVVIKVPMNCPSFNFGLTKMGFVMVETQLHLSKKYVEFKFDDRLIRHLLKGVEEKIITSNEELEMMLGHITPNMFSTDRIYIDSYFGSRISLKRYSNWIRSEFLKKTAIIKIMLYEGVEVGFCMHRENDGELIGLLGGVYEDKQTAGYGILTSCFEFLMAKKNGLSPKKLSTTISSNNIPMLQIYNYLQFKIDSMSYVYIKHQ